MTDVADVTAVEIDDHDYTRDETLQTLAPFDETRCTDCDTIIGAFLRTDPETTADVPTFRGFWRVSDGRLLCEDCWIDVIDPEGDDGGSYFDPRDPAINELAERLAEELRVPVSVDFNNLSVHVTIADARRLLK